jgi:hypothetical protein
MGALEKALAGKLGDVNNNDDLLKAMKSLLILLLTDAPKSEDDMLMEGMRDRITGRRKFSSLANTLIAKPM